MTRWFFPSLVVLVCAPLAAGCGDACDDLEDRCESCEPDQALRCAIVVGEENADSCQMLLDDSAFQAGCP
ncbi:MAG: hypothetical protein JRI23_21820 [Deltaproteobacteria bacterium]|jgi:hypothetical protein|nr:hypothetical protein [Deltaproteobacteria bacterium]MBW2534588.1 hypothetical protein [Deltaproteobacteria bacterium]